MVGLASFKACSNEPSKVCEQGDSRAHALFLLMLIPGQFNNKASVRKTIVNKPPIYSLFPFIHD